MRRFFLDRIKDSTGVSGTGRVADGVLFDDGRCVLRWRSAHTSTATYDSLADLEAIHGHNGATKVRWLDPPMTDRIRDLHERAMLDCIQDGCENAPFSTVGGLSRRRNMIAPKWIADADKDEYLNGYRVAALQQWGEGWETCEFSWGPALTIGGQSDRVEAEDFEPQEVAWH